MALKLGIPKEPRWLDLGHGVRVFVRPCTTPVYNAAVQEAAAVFRDLLDARNTVQEAGAQVVAIPDLATEAGRQAHRNFLFAKCLARAAILDWEGVLGDDGEPVAVSHAAIDELMTFHTMAETFVTTYARPTLDRIVEGNGSAPSLSGTSGEGARHAANVY
jgi:hypothetical protein